MSKRRKSPRSNRRRNVPANKPPRRGYVTPPMPDDEEFQYNLDLAAGNRLGVRQVFRRGTTDLVEMCVWQSIRVDGKWEEVSRIDCAHGHVHRHYFTRTGDSKIVPLEDLTQLHAKEALDRWVSRAEDIMKEEWEANVRRWNGDAE